MAQDLETERIEQQYAKQGDHEDAGVHRTDSGEHVLHEPFVTGHVDEPDLDARRQGREREAEIDREPAHLLFGEAVGVGAREREHERRLAVVDVTGSSDDPHASAS